ISYYTPRPPRIAAPSVKECSSPGQCKIQRMDAFTFDTQSEGVIDVPGGQHRADIRFYAWADHNQMPIRSLSVDWGDGTSQDFPDARLKNHKPFCGTQKECSDPINGHGVTCQTDADCPAGTGQCQDQGTCSRNQNITCHSNNDCPVIKSDPVALKTYQECLRMHPDHPESCTNPEIRDTCILRTMFGNSNGACEQNFFEYQHLYTCNLDDAKRMPLCGKVTSPGKCNDDTAKNCTTDADCAAGVSCKGQVFAAQNHCSRDPGRTCSLNGDCAPGDTCVDGLAPPGGCFDAAANACRYTPRVLVEDNWGWCTGECRDQMSQVGLRDSSSQQVWHQYGGCYSWSTQGATEPNVKLNTTKNSSNLNNECDGDKFPNAKNPSIRPWIVYPGSLELRKN
ncbi:MAG TPA: hypothetical protein VFQ60_05275, partial [Patescibacteria group bacterium]|nr:hypothetical protein [Patescibacteria group bacterium]